MQCRFKPRACISVRSFPIGRVIWFLAFIANRTTSMPKPKLPQLVPPCGGHACPFRVAWVGRRIYADFGSNSAFQSQSRVSTWLLFISKGEFVFLIRREQNHRITGFRPTVTDATCCSFGGHAFPEDARMGRRIDEFRLILISVPVARSDHCSYRCGYTTFILSS